MGYQEPSATKPLDPAIAHERATALKEDFKLTCHCIFSTLASIASSLLQQVEGKVVCNVHLFNEQYIVKQPHSGVAFGWHTDANEQVSSAPNPRMAPCSPLFI